MRKSRKQVLWDYAEAIVTALILALLIRAYVVQAFKIPTGSMIPTLLIGDHILVNKFIYGTEIPFTDKRVLVWQEPEKGDIVVFKYPQDPSRDFIKRIVAVEGDVVESRDKKLFVNGKPVEEPYVRYDELEVIPRGVDPRDNFGPLVVPPDKIFVMGDNRDHSHDSRYWGFVDEAEIRGKAFIIYWSWDKDRHLPRLGRIADVLR